MASLSSDVPAQVEKYDVFLSFRGDTRNNYTSFLHEALRRRGIDVFIDDELNRGDQISPSLSKAIEESKISIIVFSKDYASSTWCLEELVKILDCMNKFDQHVIPIFYHIDPSQVRHQTGHCEEAFAGYEARLKDKVPIWKKALAEAANLSGEHLDGTKPESPRTEKIASDCLERLNRWSPSENNDLVGIESKIAAIEPLLRIGSSEDVCIIVGIWGMGGIGKTTLACAIFNKIKTKFNSSHFLYVEQKPTFSEHRLPRKKVIIVFDNVTSVQQIEKITRDLKGLGPGSRVIITSRDKQLLSNCGVKNENIYKVEELCFDQALQLFSQHAFKQNFPKVDYMELADKIVKYAKGIPLALYVLGSSLFEKEKEYWKSQINKLEKIPHQDILKVLKVTYDGLDDNQESIFLDVACFFNQKEYGHVIEILEACGIDCRMDIDILINKGFISKSIYRNSTRIYNNITY